MDLSHSLQTHTIPQHTHIRIRRHGKVRSSSPAKSTTPATKARSYHGISGGFCVGFSYGFSYGFDFGLGWFWVGFGMRFRWVLGWFWVVFGLILCLENQLLKWVVLVGVGWCWVAMAVVVGWWRLMLALFSSSSQWRLSLLFFFTVKWREYRERM